MLKSMRSALVWRGVLTVIIGVVAVAWPSITVGVFVVLYAVNAFLAAGTDLAIAFRADRAGPVVGYLLLALLSATAGVLALVWPGITALVLTLMVAAWALTTGIVEVSMAFRRGRKAGERAMWALGGLASTALGVALAVRPDIGALSLATVFGFFSLIYGATMLTLAAQTRRSSDTEPRLASAA